MPVQSKPASVQSSVARKLLKWFGIGCGLLVLSVVGLLGALYLNPLQTEQPVGFSAVQIAVPDSHPISLGIWYPTHAPVHAKWIGSMFMQVAEQGPVQGERLPLVLISHGTGGGITSHADLALALAAAGFVVAAPMHDDNYLDQSSVGTPAYFTGRSRQLQATLDHMLQRWAGRRQLDANRIGAYGFSMGAFTVLTAAGAKPDLRGVAQYCAQHAEFACDLLRQSQSFMLNPTLPADVDQFSRDTRLKALVLAAPGLGFTFHTPGALAEVKLPLQLWQGDQDDLVPAASNAEVLRSNYGASLDYQRVTGAAHLSFLLPCGLLSVLPTCQDPAGFDRQAFHIEMNQQVTTFFNTQLK